ncbi:N-acetylglucosaminyl transferase component-domain-containing protein [Microdochium bolleyi]|uniref:N-acetylglucosaminyl transferase component-domain-containing protein n=1 Tax=Microdochium bolleyi TaxID=196109 RepID=A0A136IZ34_9PEZI|nr:N-acetylglucosaminyl transferase component-domain-containing protein [Microdochium bolleyi]
MHPFSVLTLAIFVAGYTTARWDLVTRLYELAIFAWDKGVIIRAAQGFAFLTVLFLTIFLPVRHIAQKAADLRLLLTGVLQRQRLDMVERDGLMRVFWPADITTSENPGVIVGWRNSGLDVVVVAVLEHVETRSVDNALKTGILLRSAPHSVSRIFDSCGQPSLHVLGVTNSAPDNPDNDPSWVCALVNPTSRVPRMTCLKATSVQAILFTRPRPRSMQYISLRPIALALGDKGPSHVDVLDGSDLGDDARERQQNAKSRLLVNKLRQHTVVQRTPTQRDKALAKIVNQINWAWEIECLLQKNVPLIGTRPKRALSVSERVVEHATTMGEFALIWLWDKIIAYVFPFIRRVFMVALLGHRLVAEFLLLVLEWRLRPTSPALKDISATAQQVEIRLQQFCYWPMQYVKLRLRKNDWDSVTTSHPDYIRFYNSLWLVANDVIIGIALGSYIIENANWVAHQISMLLGTYTITALQSSISWLMGWPAGLKLNSELALFLGDLFLWVIDYWAGCIETLQPLLPHIVWFIGFSSFAGASMPVALLSDLLSILTVHIYSFYLASARIFHWQLTILLSLFQLFRGKKYNVLRNRVDSCAYDLDQLLVGTILFTLLSFLLPTVVVFYLNFALARMVIISLKAVFDTMLSCLNHFPLFALMLRVKDPQRLPGGVRFELCENRPKLRVSNGPSEATTYQLPTSVINLRPIPLSFTAMFHQYFQMGNRIRKHYLSPHVLFCLVTGRFVPPIHRKNLYSLQYSMLPARRAGIVDMWEALNALPAKKRPVLFYPYGYKTMPNLPAPRRGANGRTRSGL